MERIKTQFRAWFHWIRSHPNSWVRVPVALSLILGGILGFLPVLGFWMIPLGLILLAVDFPWARRLYLAGIVLWRRHRHRVPGRQNGSDRE
ncbi:MAG: hypothetical protein QF586_03250 [Arenicellales bacterium]|nr:hypothetical protein [Acidiferrobacteraceae bacterium]MDP6289218.1 hypothetical protein [Arenicellales bacterium]MBT58705.1 hypothetical protein [Acidiferrobacteraceae bacterium]MDP6434823.1 hypothetical protein [Arenicellales bacterium]MDP6724122.1 hypothetical protein [Arenicellales bacterium]